MKKCIVVKHLGREEVAVDGTCSKSPPLKRLCQDVQVCFWGDERRNSFAMGLSPANQSVQNHCSASLGAPIL